MNEKITGKQLACDALALAKNIGIYLIDLSKYVCAKLKTALDAAHAQTSTDETIKTPEGR